MIDTVVFGIVIFVLGFAAGILATLWWQGSKRPQQLKDEDPQVIPPTPEQELQVTLNPLQNQEQPLPARQIKKGKKVIEPPKVEKPPVDMVAEINQILKEMILKSQNPEYIISLTSDPPVGVSFWVNGKHFSDLDSVNEDAKALIRRAVSEWENGLAKKM
jgi:hypothetical protein